MNSPQRKRWMETPTSSRRRSGASTAAGTSDRKCRRASRRCTAARPARNGFHCGNPWPPAQRLRGEITKRVTGLVLIAHSRLTRNLPGERRIRAASSAMPRNRRAMPTRSRIAGRERRRCRRRCAATAVVTISVCVPSRGGGGQSGALRSRTCADAPGIEQPGRTSSTVSHKRETDGDDECFRRSGEAEGQR